MGAAGGEHKVAFEVGVGHGLARVGNPVVIAVADYFGQAQIAVHSQSAGGRAGGDGIAPPATAACGQQRSGCCGGWD